MTSLTHEDVTQTLRLIDELPDGELILSKGDLSLTIRKGPSGCAPLSVTPVAPQPTAPVVVPVAATVTPEKPQIIKPDIIPEGAVQRSPMMGTFYRSSSPGEPPLVEIGTRVEVGDPLCLVEVMKLFNSITADTAGTIVAIHVQDGDIVDNDAPLFSIQPR